MKGKNYTISHLSTILKTKKINIDSTASSDSIHLRCMLPHIFTNVSSHCKHIQFTCTPWNNIYDGSSSRTSIIIIIAACYGCGPSASAVTIILNLTSNFSPQGTKLRSLVSDIRNSFAVLAVTIESFNEYQTLQLLIQTLLSAASRRSFVFLTTSCFVTPAIAPLITRSVVHVGFGIEETPLNDGDCKCHLNSLECRYCNQVLDCNLVK